MLKFLTLLLLFSSYSLKAREFKACKTNADCRIVNHTCGCMYCARPTDLDTKLIDSVNLNFVPTYEERSKCSKDQLKSCSMAGACARLGTFEAQCVKNTCGAVFKSSNL